MALEVLIALSADSDPYVREWATFGLARQTDQDVPHLRDALAARLDDDPDTLAEAIHGLAVRGDERALPPLLRFLASPPPVDDPNVIDEAAYALAGRYPDCHPCRCRGCCSSDRKASLPDEAERVAHRIGVDPEVVASPG